MTIISKPTVLLLAMSSLALAVPRAELEDRESACGDAHLIVARGSIEPPGEGIIITVAATIAVTSHQNITQEAIDYPALLDPYDLSVTNGTAAVKRQVAAFAQRCPQTEIVLIGYSQGAQIIGDAMCGGGGGQFGEKTPPLDTPLRNRVVAVLQMGDPRYTFGESYHVGTAINQGLFPRLSDQSCEPQALKFRSYCDSGDPFCDSGHDLLVHLTYPAVYGSDAARWVVDKIGG